MANKLLSMLIIKRILQLLEKGKKVKVIAGELNISVNTVRKYARLLKETGKSYSELLSLEIDELEKYVYSDQDDAAKSSRQVELEKLLPKYIKRLNNSHSTRYLLWEEYKKKHPEGYSYSQFCEHISRYLQQNEAVMHLIHKPGDLIQIDFAGHKLSYTDRRTGRLVYCPVFVCVLPFSRFCYLEALPNMKQKEMAGSLARCFIYFGGVTKNLCCDNFKQVVTKADKYEPEFSEFMNQFALHYNVSLTATRIIKPRDKASVERHVGVAYSRIFAIVEQQQFYSLEELNRAILKQLDILNDSKMQRHSFTRRSYFLEHEYPLLQPLPREAFEIKYQTMGKVQRNYHVILGEDWHNYSVPHQYIGKKVKLIYDSRNVEIYYDSRRIAMHKRDFTKNGFSTIESHQPANHQIASEIQKYTPGDFIEQAEQIGTATRELIEAIIEDKFFSQQIFKSCLGILRLGNIYGNQRLEKACSLALQGASYNYQAVKTILKNNMDKAMEEKQQDQVTDQNHSNIRGKDFFSDFCAN